jgi:hypothetical protein
MAAVAMTRKPSCIVNIQSSKKIKRGGNATLHGYLIILVSAPWAWEGSLPAAAASMLEDFLHQYRDGAPGAASRCASASRAASLPLTTINKLRNSKY